MSELVGLEVEQRDDVVIARLTGELDLSGAPEVGRALEEAVPPSARGLLLDFTGLEFMESSGVAMLFALGRRLSGARQQLRLVVGSGTPVARVLEIVEFQRVAPVEEDLDAALAALGA